MFPETEAHSLAYPRDNDEDPQRRETTPLMLCNRVRLDFGDAIEPSVFEQILEMDEDDEQDFSKGIVVGFFEQAQDTFKQIQEAMYA